MIRILFTGDPQFTFREDVSAIDLRKEQTGIVDRIISYSKHHKIEHLFVLGDLTGLGHDGKTLLGWKVAFFAFDLT